MSRYKEFKEAIAKAAERFKSFDPKQTIRVISHLDADGISACAILIHLLNKENRKYSISIIPQLTKEKLIEFSKEEYPYFMFTDLGSGQLSAISEVLKSKRIMILDHHDPEKTNTPENIIHVNPHLSGIDGSVEISGAGVVYLFAAATDSYYEKLAHLAIIGAIGDVQETKGVFKQLNNEILQTALDKGLLKAEKGLRLFGTQTKPLHKVLEYSTDPYIPGVSGSESGAIQFLHQIGINPKKGDDWKKIIHLTDEEMQKLVTGIIMKRLDEESPEDVLGLIYTLPNEKSEVSTKDAKEFATLLNACVNPETEIYTNGLPIKIKELKCKDSFSLNRNFNLEKDKIIEVNKIKLPKEVKVLEIISDSNKKIKATENHEFITIKDGIVSWTPASKLKKGDLVGTPKKINIDGELDADQRFKFEFSKTTNLKKINIPKFNNDVCTLIGYVIGDGYVGEHSIKIAFPRSKEGEETSNIISKLFKKLFGIEAGKTENRRNYYVCSWNSKMLCEWFRTIGIPKGKKSHIIKLDPRLIQLNDKCVSGLLKGLFSSDGSYYKNHLEFATHSAKLARQAQYLLLRIGLNSHFKENFCHDCKKQKYRILLYSADNFRLFLKRIGFISKNKNKKIKIMRVENKANTNILPINKILLKLVRFFRLPREWSAHFTYYRSNKSPTTRNIRKFINYFKIKGNDVRRAINSGCLNDIINTLEFSKRRFAKEAGLSRVWLDKILKNKKCGKNAKNKLNNVISHLKGTLEENMRLLEYIDKLINSDVLWAKIKDIRVVKRPPKYVYDLKSHINPNYVANGFIIHNCGRLDKSSFGIGACLGIERDKKRAFETLAEYRKEIINAMKWYEENKGSKNIIKDEKFIIINTEDNIIPTMVGTLASILSKSNDIKEGTYIMTLGRNLDKTTKISLRISGRREQSKDLREILKSISARTGGEAGGHQYAAGCIIPTEKEEEFIKTAKEILIKKGMEESVD